eukprot:9095021-Pyramimonas_sp.AAC.1
MFPVLSVAILAAVTEPLEGLLPPTRAVQRTSPVAIPASTTNMSRRAGPRAFSSIEGVSTTEEAANPVVDSKEPMSSTLSPVGEMVIS